MRKTIKQIATENNIDIRSLRTQLTGRNLSKTKGKGGNHFKEEEVLAVYQELLDRIEYRKTKDEVVTEDGVEYQTLQGLSKSFNLSISWLRHIMETGDLTVVPIGHGVFGNRYKIEEVKARVEAKRNADTPEYKENMNIKLSLTDEEHTGTVHNVLDNNDFIFKSDDAGYLDCRFNTEETGIFNITKEEINNIHSVAGGFASTIGVRKDGHLNIFFVKSYKIKVN